jgi:hypothetical protein
MTDLQTLSERLEGYCEVKQCRLVNDKCIVELDILDYDEAGRFYPIGNLEFRLIGVGTVTVYGPVNNELRLSGDSLRDVYVACEFLKKSFIYEWTLFDWDMDWEQKLDDCTELCSFEVSNAPSKHNLSLYKELKPGLLVVNISFDGIRYRLDESAITVENLLNDPRINRHSG